MRAKAVVALLVLVSLAMMGQVPSSRKVMFNEYRNIVMLGENGTGAVPDTILRFPRKSLGTNACLPAGFPELYQGVNWVHATLVKGGSGQPSMFIVCYSNTFPSGADTLRVSGNVRTATIGGMHIDSLRVLAATACTLRVSVSD